MSGDAVWYKGEERRTDTVKMRDDFVKHMQCIVTGVSWWTHGDGGIPVGNAMHNLKFAVGRYVDAMANNRYGDVSHEFVGYTGTPPTLAAQCAVALTRACPNWRHDDACPCWRSTKLPEQLLRLMYAADDATGIITETMGGYTVGRTLLHYACKMHELKVVKMLLAAGANVNLCNNLSRYTPLHYAVVRIDEIPYETHNIVELVTVLLDAGADVNALTKQKRSALDFIAVNMIPGYVDIMRCLMKYGAKFDKLGYREALQCRKMALDGGALDIVAALDACKTTRD